MGRGPTIRNKVRPPFLADRHSVHISVIMAKIRRGEIRAEPTRISKRTGEPTGFLITRREVERLDRIGLRPRVVVPSVTIAGGFATGREAVAV